MGWLAVLGMGLVLGALGGGGGILTVPILVGFFGFGAAEATGSSLLVVGLASCVGAVKGILNKQIEWQAGLSLAVPSMIGALSARLFVIPSIPDPVFGVAKDDLLLGLFALIMLVIGYRMLLPEKAEPKVEANQFKIAAVGLLIGLVSGVLGAGGGFLILPALTLLLGIELKRAIPTSLFVISIQSLGGFAGELGRPIQWSLLGGVIATAMLGLLLGLVIREKAPQGALKTSFAILVFLVSAWLIFRVLS
jgi:uncharacterized membrane protein YfcA